MGSRRTLILIAAIAVGAIAAFLVWNYVGGIEERANGNAQRLKVYVVRTEVPKGTYGEDTKNKGLIVEAEIPKQFYPPNAIRSFDDILGKRAINDLAPNQIVTNDMFADPTQVSATFARLLEKIQNTDQVTVTVSVDDVRGAAGLLQPGDYVNVMASTQVGDASGDNAPLNSTQFRYVYQKARIFAIGQTPVPQAGEAQTASTDGTDPAASQNQNAGLVTLIVPARAAQQIATLGDNIYLSLVAPDYTPTPMGPLPLVEQVNPGVQPLPGEDPNALTPYGKDGTGK